jgi:hypothetical protein
MNPDEKEQLRQYVERWKRVGPELEEIRRREIREADNVQVLALLESSFNYAITLPPRQSSGMVEMQRVLSKLWPKREEE